MYLYLSSFIDFWVARRIKRGFYFFFSRKASIACLVSSNLLKKCFWNSFEFISVSGITGIGVAQPLWVSWKYLIKLLDA